MYHLTKRNFKNYKIRGGCPFCRKGIVFIHSDTTDIYHLCEKCGAKWKENWELKDLRTIDGKKIPYKDKEIFNKGVRS